MPDTTADTSRLQRVASGDPDAVRDVIAEYGDLVWSLARRFTTSEVEAEDATQEVFLVLWRKADRFDPERGSETTFVSVLTRRVLIDRWRREGKKPRGANDSSSEKVEGSLATSIGADEELVRLASQAFETLDVDHRTVLRFSLDQGRSHSEIAELTGQPLGTVKSRIRNGLRQIRDMVEGRTREGGGAR